MHAILTYCVRREMMLAERVLALCHLAIHCHTTSQQTLKGTFVCFKLLPVVPATSSPRSISYRSEHAYVANWDAAVICWPTRPACIAFMRVVIGRLRKQNPYGIASTACQCKKVMSPSHQQASLSLGDEPTAPTSKRLTHFFLHFSTWME